MKQALHILKKDVRHLRLEICLVVLLCYALPLLWPVAAAYLIARLIHSEAIPGGNQFWITRPYRWTSLIAAKLLFIGLFINVPFFLVQIYYLFRLGFTLPTAWAGLLWLQILLVMCLSLPAAALAAITSGMIAYGFLELIAVAIVFVDGQVSFLGLTSPRPPWPAGVEWIPKSFVIGTVTAAAIVILILQYRRRKTFISSVVAAIATVIGASIFFFLPPQFALNAETGADPMKLALTPYTMKLGMLGQGRSSQIQITLPIEIGGVPPDVDLKADALAGVFRAAGGRASKVFTNWAETRIDPSGNRVVKAVFTVDRAFFQTERDRPVDLHASLYLSAFGNPRSQTIPQQREPRTVLDQFRCSTAELEKLVELRCWSAFRWPGQMVYAQIHEKYEIPFFPGISYSPFPAELSLSPFEFHSALGSQGLAPPSPLGPPPPPEVTIIAKQALAHIRRDLDVRGIRFSDLTDVETLRISPPPPKRPKTK